MSRRAIVITGVMLAVCAVGVVALKPGLANARSGFWRRGSLTETSGFTVAPGARINGFVVPIADGDSASVGPYCPILPKGAFDAATPISAGQPADSLSGLFLEGQSSAPTVTDSAMCVGTKPPLPQP